MATKPATKKPAAKKSAAKPSTAVATTKATPVTTGAEIIARILAKGRVALAKAPASGSAMISFKSGMMTLAGHPVKGSELDIVILAPSFERLYYPGEYDADNPAPPSCYSFDGATPHPESAEPQSAACEQCPQNQWDTGPRGRGKACKEGTRIACLPLPKGGITAEHAQSAPLAAAKFSVLNSRDLSPKISALYDKFGAPFKAVMRLSVAPDATRQLVNDLEFVEEITDPDILEAITSRLVDADGMLNKPYKALEPSETAPTRKGKPAAGKSARRY